MAYKVLIPQDIVEEGKDYLRQRGYEIRIGGGISPERIAADAADCDAILIRTALIPASVLEAGKKLRVVSRHGVGTDNIDVVKATELGIWVTFAPESNANTVAEHTIGVLIALARHFLSADRAVREGDWGIRDRLTGSDLAGRVLGIVGLGKIGRRVAKKAALGLEMQVMGYDPYLKPGEFPEHVIPVTNRDDIFAASDFVTLHLPATASTKGSVGEREFGLMKRTAFFINAARSDIADESALVAVLRNGLIAGAALDVFPKEPPEKENPLLGLDNVLLTPHNASLTKQCIIRMALHAAQGIDEVLSGKRPTWPVNEPISKR